MNMEKFKNYNDILQGGIVMSLISATLILIQVLLVLTIDHDYLPEIFTNYDNGKSNIISLFVMFLMFSGLILFIGLLEQVSQDTK